MLLAWTVGLLGCSGSGIDTPDERQGVVSVQPAEARRLADMRPERRRELFSEPERREALRASAIDLLRSATQAGDPQMRANAFEALELAPDVLAEVVGRGLVDANVGVRSIAAVAAGRAGLTGQADTLRAMLVDESAYVRASAAFALGRLGLLDDRSLLVSAMLEGETPGVRGHAVFLAGELGDRALLPQLKEAARRRMPRASSSERRLVDLQISEAMVKLGDEDQLGPIRAALYPSSASDLEATALAVQIVGEVQDRAMRGRLAQLADLRGPTGEPMPAEIQLAIAISMAKLGDRAGSFVADANWESDRFVLRSDAASVYGLCGREEDLARLQVMLSDRVGIVRVAAAAGVLRNLAVSARAR
ncbi:MAG: HEAT repeat domain-containing protein [Phycisphaerales bacterium]